jgi:hypothetical protein
MIEVVGLPDAVGVINRNGQAFVSQDRDGTNNTKLELA